VDGKIAWTQWNKLKATIEKCGAKVELVEQGKDLPDMVFTANAGMMWKNKVYISHFKHPERQGERSYYEKWFQSNGFEVFGDTKENFEGAGDALMAGEKLFGAYGFRTDAKVYDKILNLFNVKSPFVLCKLEDPRFYHIDTCFCPISKDKAIWFPKAFSADSRKKMEAELNLIAVPEKEAERFACNSVVIGKSVITPGNCPETGKLLEKEGFEVHSCEMTEFLKAGGACKCLTLAV